MSFSAHFRPIHAGWILTRVSGPTAVMIPPQGIPAVVPGCVHTDLLRVGLIDDPFDGLNEKNLQWVGATQWRYTTSFEWEDDGHTRHDIVAYGLDTLATVVVNGVVVGQTENQHRSYRFDVHGLLRTGSNTIEVTFAAPLTEVLARDQKYGSWPHVNTHAFNQIRKSASNFGWDWGIDVATSGIWQPIGLEAWSGVRIHTVRPLVAMDARDGLATVHVEIERDGVSVPSDLTLRVHVGESLGTATFHPRQSRAIACVRVPNVDMWWPVGHGDQSLYPVRVDLDGHDTWQGRVGFRTVELDTSPDGDGNRCVLKVNGHVITVRGVNWIPDHAFLTEMTRERYVRRLVDALDANVNLIRVWGGGIYESEDFYDYADEAGILVWQDFLFACAAYSEEDWLADEVEAEAREHITRLAPHPSLVVWNGCNENLWGYVDWGWREALAGRPWGNGYYTRLLPRLLAELDPTRPYSPGTPFSFVEYAHPNDPRNGTAHLWDVWNERDYTAYRDYRPRFVSEFGFQAPPAW